MGLQILKENGGGRGGAESFLREVVRREMEEGDHQARDFEMGTLLGRQHPSSNNQILGSNDGWEEGGRIGLTAHNTRIATLIHLAERKDTDHGGAALDAGLVAIMKGLGGNK